MSALTSFALDCGRLVAVCEWSVGYSYAGWLEGYPEPGKFLDIALKRAREKYSYCPVHVIPPIMVEFFPGRDPRPALPHYCMLAYMMSWQPIDPAMDMSHMAVLWFEPNIMNRPLDTVLRDALHGVPWKSAASDGLI